MAFVRDEEGELHPAFEPREMQSEERAGREARYMGRQRAVCRRDRLVCSATPR
jgi:hypothetical protein